ncbi:hypothetical protein ABBQ32_010370 [Trebouxia sp. C0010 RCD-2024]
MSPRHDSAAWAIRASSASGTFTLCQAALGGGPCENFDPAGSCGVCMFRNNCLTMWAAGLRVHLCWHAGGGFSPFITPASTPRGNAISRSGSVTSSNAGSTPRWSSSSYGPVAFGSPVKTDGMSTPRAAAISLLASSPKIPAAIAGMPMVPALSPSTSGQGSSPAGLAPKPPPRRTTSDMETERSSQPLAGQQPMPGSTHTPGKGPRRSRSNLSDQNSRHTISASPLSEGLRVSSRHTSNCTEV